MTTDEQLEARVGLAFLSGPIAAVIPAYLAWVTVGGWIGVMLGVAVWTVLALIVGFIASFVAYSVYKL